MKSDLEIAQSIPLKHVSEIAQSIGIIEEELELYGKYKAKISLDILQRYANKPNGKYIVVTCVTPTPLGEGKTITTVGLGMALNKIGKKAITCIRQPSMGPMFGIKGGAAGGGNSQVIPMDEFNLHLTGDIHAVGVAHNLLSAFIDNSLHHKNELNIDPYSITWRRVVDISDRALRDIVIGLGSSINGPLRQTGFDITVASEVMAILALSKDLKDLRQRLGNIVIGSSLEGKYITAEDLKCAGAMTVLLKDAIKPTLMQTTEHTPCFVHTGPFANIAHGNSSILADMIALKCSDYVITESGFGADMGAEKFVNIKCRYSDLAPNAAVLVCTVRAIKMHSGEFNIIPGKPLDEALLKENTEALKQGLPNLKKQIENIITYKIPVVVAINKFLTDTDTEIRIIQEAAINAGADAAIVSELHQKGSEGGRLLAEAIVKAADKPNAFQFLYPLDIPIKEKIEIIAVRMYGAEGVDYSPFAQKQIKEYAEKGLDSLPICMAKTHLSLSHDPKLKGRPQGFRIPIREIRAYVGAGFLTPLLGDMMTMPGLPTIPAGTMVDIDDNGKPVGLF